MKSPTATASSVRGSTLIEAVIAVGVLAVAVPLVFGAMAEGGKTAAAAQAETRSTWIIPACIEEVRASREGKPRFFTATTTGQVFPPAGEVWALAFAKDGKLIGKISKDSYNSGTKTLNGQTVRYIASMVSTEAVVRQGATPMLDLRITLEFPAAAKATKRGKLDFLTRIP